MPDDLPPPDTELSHVLFGLMLAGEAIVKLAGVLTQGIRADNHSIRGEIAIKLHVAASRIQYGKKKRFEGVGRDVYIDDNGHAKKGKVVPFAKDEKPSNFFKE